MSFVCLFVVFSSFSVVVVVGVVASLLLLLLLLVDLLFCRFVCLLHALY